MDFRCTKDTNRLPKWCGNTNAMLFERYELKYALVGFRETLKTQQRLHSFLLCCYVHSTHPNTLRHKSKTWPGSPDIFLNRKLIFKSLYLKNGLMWETLTVKFEISTLKMMFFITKTFSVINTLREFYVVCRNLRDNILDTKIPHNHYHYY